MRDILNELYKKVVSFFLSKNGNDASKETACSRLKLVLMHDRTNLDAITLENMKDELVGVISKYIEIDKEALDLNLVCEGNSIALMASIPFNRARKQEEIDEINKALKEKALQEENDEDITNSETSSSTETTENTDVDENNTDAVEVSEEENKNEENDKSETSSSTEATDNTDNKEIEKSEKAEDENKKATKKA